MCNLHSWRLVSALWSVTHDRVLKTSNWFVRGWERNSLYSYEEMNEANPVFWLATQTMLYFLCAKENLACFRHIYITVLMHTFSPHVSSKILVGKKIYESAVQLSRFKTLLTETFCKNHFKESSQLKYCSTLLQLYPEIFQRD